MEPLATETDLVSTLPPGAPMPVGDAARALDVASDAVRAAARARISQADITVTLPAPNGRKLTLPGPVKDVTLVLVDGNAVTEYRPDVDGLWCNDGWSYHGYDVTVSYTYGYDPVPGDVVDLVCQLALEWLEHNASGGGSTAGLSSVKIDDGAETYTAEASAQVSPVYVPGDQADRLAQRFGGGGAIAMEFQ